MKVQVLFFLSLLAYTYTSFLNAQTFGGEGTKWIYSYSSEGTPEFGTTTVEFVRDTLIENKFVQVFSRKGVRYNLQLRDTNYVNFGELYLLIENNTVQISLNLQDFDTLYHFTNEIGSRWEISLDKYGLVGEMEFRLIDTFQTEINGFVLSGQKVFFRTDYFSGIDTVYETIGGQYNYIMPWDVFRVDQEGGNLMCFQNTELGVVDFGPPPWDINYFDNYCNNSVSNIGREEKNLQIEIFPNPVESIFYIEIPTINFSKDKHQLKLINSHGKLVLQKELTSSYQIIDTSSLLQGMYFVLLNDRAISKIIVQ